MKTYGNSVMTCTVDTSGFTRVERKLLASVRNPSKPLKVAINEIRAAISKAWRTMTYRKLYSVTGFMASVEFRPGIKWKPVRPMYGRITDATPVDPMGQTQRLDGTGNVQGRLRPSGTRVKPDRIVGQDTKAMSRDFTSNVHISADKRTVSLITNVEYAKEQNALRQFNKITTGDRKRVVVIVKEWLGELAKRINRGER